MHASHTTAVRTAALIHVVSKRPNFRRNIFIVALTLEQLLVVTVYIRSNNPDTCMLDYFDQLVTSDRIRVNVARSTRQLHTRRLDVSHSPG